MPNQTHDPHRDPIGGLLAERTAKDAFFRSSPHSPIPAADRAPFAGLAYFAPDPALRFAGLTPGPNVGGGPERFSIPTSDGDLRPARRAGSFRFELAGVDLVLTA